MECFIAVTGAAKHVRSDVMQNTPFSPKIVPLPSSRHHLSNDDCLEIKAENYQTVLFCIVHDSCAQWYAHT